MSDKKYLPPKTADLCKCCSSDAFLQMSKNTVAADRQLRETDYVHFYNLCGTGKKVMFVGNSITLHGIKRDIGWNNEWGMAASAKENDYVHRLMAEISKIERDPVYCICQVASWELQYKHGESIYHLFKNARNFNADIIIMRFVENCPKENFEKQVFKRETVKLLQFLNSTKKANIILTTGFWHHPADVAIAELAEEMNLPLVKLGDLGEKDEMKAIGKFEHSGVANHPGDLGMKMIANRIFMVLKRYLQTSS